MKIKILFFALLLAGTSACAYKSCPTYAKKTDAPKEVVLVKKQKV